MKFIKTRCFLWKGDLYLLPAQQSTPKGSSRKVGNRRLHCSTYVSHGTLLKNKLKRIAKSNGGNAVMTYKRDIHAKFPSENKKER